jgi:hypothetical protein
MTMFWISRLESGRAVRNEGALRLGDTVGKRELELGSHQLLDVWAADILRLLDFNHAKNLRQN